ncbi:hypothetical protein MMC11_000630 [Xylographa trunciseda]|nr:hypothetical protein [Xylographa trunciseda]
MNAGERGRPRRWTGASPPISALPEPVSPGSQTSLGTNQDAQPERVQSLPSPRKRRKRQVVEDSDDESDAYATQNVRVEKRRKTGIKEVKAIKRARSAEDTRTSRVTRAAAKAFSDIRESADFLLALGSSSPHSTTLAIGEGNRDELGLMLLAEAAALTGSPRLETNQGHDAQVHSPLFFDEDTDLVTLRGSEVATERETSVENRDTPQTARRRPRRKPQTSVGERLQVSEPRVAPAVLTYRLPLELTELTYASQSATGSQRLRDLYQSALVVKGLSGKTRPLRKQRRDDL